MRREGEENDMVEHAKRERVKERERTYAWVFKI